MLISAGSVSSDCSDGPIFQKFAEIFRPETGLRVFKQHEVLSRVIVAARSSHSDVDHFGQE